MQMLLTKAQACEWARHLIENLEKAGDGPYPEALESIHPEVFDSFLYDEKNQDVMMDENDLAFLNQMDPPRFSMEDVVSVVRRTITAYPGENLQYIGGSETGADGKKPEDALAILFSALEELFGEEGILAGQEERLCECDNGHEQAGTVCRFCYAKNIYRRYAEQCRRKGEN